MKLRSSLSVFLFVATVLAFTSGCMKPYDVPEFVRIENNETAFVIPVTGANKTSQGKFDSQSFLQEKKVGTKRIRIPHEWIQTGRMFNSGKWIDTVRVLRVDRSPVSRRWTVETDSGTTNTDQAIYVESKDSIGFYVGVSLTAAVEEDDTALYLYRFPTGRDLATVIDSDVQSFVQAELSAAFGKIPLEDKFEDFINAEGEKDQRLVLAGCKTDKTRIFEEAAASIKTYFKDTFGITIYKVGHIGGLAFEDKEIQVAINATFLAEKRIETARMEKEEQEELNARELSIEVNDRLKAEEFNKALDAQREKIKLDIDMLRARADFERAQKWDGKLPSNILPAGSPLLYGLQSQN